MAWVKVYSSELFKDASMLQIEFGSWNLPNGGWIELTSLRDGAVEPVPEV